MRIILAAGLLAGTMLSASGAQAAALSPVEDATVLSAEPASQWRGGNDGDRNRGGWENRGRGNDRGNWNRGDRGGWDRDGRGDRDRSERDWGERDRNDRDRNDRERGDRDRNERWDGNDRWDRDDRYNRYRQGGAYYRGGNYGNYGGAFGVPRYRDRDDNRRWDNGWRRDTRYNWSDYRRQHRDLYRSGRYSNPYGNRSYSRFRIGIRVDQPYYNSRYWIGDPWRYRLPPVYGNYRWVRYYDDVLLIDTRSGFVQDVIYDFFW